MAATNNYNQNDYYQATVPTRENQTTEFMLPRRYQEIQYIGSGGFGSVVSAYDTVLKRRVAIKKISGIFSNHIHAQRVYRELKYLIHINHPNNRIVQLYNVYTPETDPHRFTTLYFVLNYLPKNLHQFISQSNPLGENEIKLLIYHLLCAVKYLHSVHIVHRDIKPANIGVDENLRPCLLDFGLVRRISDDNNLVTGYVSTRWWRAPEIYLSWEQYDKKVDIWSIACVMAELILRKPIFPGDNDVTQMKEIMKIVGTPSVDTLKHICDKNTFKAIPDFEQYPKANYQEVFGIKRDPTTNRLLSGISDQGIEFLDYLLKFDPRTRPSAEEALQHPYLADFHDSDNEPVPMPIEDPYLDVINNLPFWRSTIWKLIQNFQPPAFLEENDSEFANMNES